MQRKVIFRMFFVLIMSCLINACVSSKKTQDSLSSKEEAALYLKMGVRYLEMNMLKTAKEKLEDAVDLDSSNVEIRNALGALYERLGQFQQAREQYQTAIEFNSDNVSIKNNYGRFLCKRGEYQEGIAILEQALQMPLNNRRWYAYHHIGHCALLKGDEETAEGFFRQALIENAEYAPALSQLQKVSYKNGKFMSARAFLERYLAVAKHTPRTLWYAVQTERSLGNEVLSDGYRQQLLTQFPASQEARQLKTAIR